ncbi:phospholipase D family protein [Serratia quinivorans]|uniref:phospholipase D family protein n=1 Tax=Serratia quinivorans TaxID=137545 RepID=UPI0034C5FCA7
MMNRRVLYTRLRAALVLYTCSAGMVSANAATQPAPLDPGARVQVGFSPAGTAQQTVLDAIASARQEVLVAAFNFTSRPVAKALLDAKKRGVEVRVVADKKANSNYTAVTYLANQGVAVALNDNYKYMHQKFLVVDGQSVETGSFNYSAGAAKSSNAENVIWLINVPSVAAQYRQEFVRLWQESTPLSPRY